MNQYQKMFPSLALFSDLDWPSVTQEYEADFIDVSFPEYLQQKAEEGDCPPYLFELAYYEMALFESKTSNIPFPHLQGIHLNPTALFLSLEFDVARMLAEAQKGTIEVYERPHVLCLFRDKNDKVRSVELDDEALTLLENLEEGPQSDQTFISSKYRSRFDEMVKNGLIFDLT
jgi:hypothetical protein